MSRWAYLVPVAYLAVVLAVQPAGRLTPLDPGRVPTSRWLFDDTDAAAWVLRGLNAAEGRTPGRLDEPEYVEPEEFARALNEPRQPAPTYFLEYPQAALLEFRLLAAAADPPPGLPAALLDARHHNLTTHDPHGPTEEAIWRGLRRGVRVHQVLAALALVLTMVVLRAGVGPGGTWAGSPWFLVLPGVLYFSLNRYDAFPSLFVLLSLAAAGRGQSFASGLCLGLGVMLKAYPAVLAPVVWRFAATDRRSAVGWAAGFALPVVGLFGWAVADAGWAGAVAPYRYQLTRPPEFEWAFYGRVLPAVLGLPTPAAGLFRAAALGVAVLASIATRPADVGSLLRRCAGVLLVFYALQVFYSPQFVVWFVPLLAPLAARSARLGWLIVAFDAVSYLSFPVVYDLPPSPTADALRVALVYARAAVFLGLAWELWRGRAPSNGSNT